MRKQCIAAIALTASLIVSGASSAQQASAPTRGAPSTPGQQRAAASDAKSILVLPPAAGKTVPVLETGRFQRQDRKLLTDAEKFDLIVAAANSLHQARPTMTGVVSAVLTLTKPFVPDQASVVIGGRAIGLFADGKSYDPVVGPYWNLQGTMIVQFIPFTPGKMTMIVFHVDPLGPPMFAVNGNNVSPIDGKIAVAVTPATKDPYNVSLRYPADSDLKTNAAVKAIEIFAVK